MRAQQGAVIDSVQGRPARADAELDRLREENDRLRRAQRHLEREYAIVASRLARLEASRLWRAVHWLRTLRPAAATPLPAIAAPAVWAGPTPPVAILAVTPGQLPAPPRETFADACVSDLGDAKYVVLWDGACKPQPGWLQALAEVFARDERAGLAGALLLAPDGRIAAAGAEIAPDGSLAPRGAGASPGHPEFSALARVATVPLGAAMLPAALWRRFGGLDPAIAEPSLALAEVALRLRAAGFSVLCQPFARVTQPAARPAPDAWAEAHGRWRVRRRRTAGGQGLASLGLPRPAAPRALFVDTSVPMPDRDSGSADLHVTARIFTGLGWEVTLLPVADLGRADGYVDDLRRHGVRVVAGGWARSAEDFLSRVPPFDLVMVHRGSLAGGPLLDRVAAHSPRARLVFNTVDLHFLRLEREALLHRSAATLDDAFQAERAELAAVARADCTIVVSPEERLLLADLLPHARTCVIPIAREIAGRRAPFAPRRGVLFVGGFRHRPNVDAIVAFVREVWPKVRARLATTLDIVGADAPAEVLALASEDVVVRGHVADLDAQLAACRLTVAPLRFGAGIKGKIVSSLAAGVPCVASPVAVEGMGLRDGMHVVVADGAEAFADAIVAVHEDASLWSALSDAGLEFALEHFSVAGARRRIAAMLGELGLPAGDG